MPPIQPFLQARARALWIAAACAAALAAAFACSTRPSDLHEGDDVKGKPCFSCHSGAYNAAANPRHVNELPQTCQDCHGTKAWVPSTAKDHPYWPILNKHVGVSCAACHTKGYKVGDTPKDCVGCHRKDYESAQNANAGGFTNHVANGVDQYPLDCTMCHADTGFKPSPWKHLSDFPPTLLPDDGERADGGLAGRHFNAPCAGCHTGKPPTYKGTPTDSDCARCHQADADKPAGTKPLVTKPNHKAFPPTCQDCHLMSGWAQGEPLSGLHPEAKFPLQPQAGKHSGILCRDCHKLEQGSATTNMDCVNCHLGGVDHHVLAAMNAYHLKTPDGGTVVNYPQGAPSTNFCLGCHGQGQHL